MRVLVVTVVHRPDDARIRQRQIKALLDAGDEVTYAAPFSDWGVEPDQSIRTIDLPRASGRHRIAAARAAREWLTREAKSSDVVLVHDPELVPWLFQLDHPARVWDVHEDTAAALTLKSWLPSPLRRFTAGGVHLLEQQAQKRVHLLLAEDGYVDRFSGQHPVVPNSTPVPTTVPAPDVPRAVYVGHVTRARGGEDLIAVGSQLRQANSPVMLEVIGHADSETSAALTRAHSAADLIWHGFLPNDQALEIVQGSMAGLSLLHDEPNYRHSKPTKVIEYMARGVPVITTPTPPAAALVEQYQCGIVIPFNDPVAVVAAISRLEQDSSSRRAYAEAGRRGALADHDWNRDAEKFVAQLHTWAGQ
jgi:glycosyltransferase involved in cell wall biosynthesis